ncbi:HpcH/HpaI aldolase family protein [Planctomicrobium sp. SH664]|uniref:HpcH/HpaI aldolase family protein n=1 Tax=Planctomicrobium sp. SH664 TaxID=3448125 RepID=UPI003F5C33A4
MARTSRVIENLKQGLPSLGVSLHLNEPSVYELTSLMGFDAIWLDLEHHTHSVESASRLIQAARVGGTDVVARPGKGEFMRMARLLEAGAAGIMYPRCDSAAEAAEVVKWARFAPLGKRGFDGSGADTAFLMTPMKEYIKRANENTYVIIQVEEPEALDQSDEILAVPGVDMLMFGPADFSVLTGIPGEFGHPSIQSGLERVARAARQAGKHWAATCGSLDVAHQYIEMGARLVFHGCDLVYVKQGLDQLREAAGEKLGMKIGPRSQGTNSYLAGN